MRAARVLIVDDDPWFQRRVTSTLGLRGHQVSVAGDAAGALALASKIRPDVIVTSASLPTVGGWSWWERLRQDGASPHAPIIFLLSVLDTSIELRGRIAGDQSLGKPFRLEDLDKAVVQALNTERLEVVTSSPAAPGSSHRPHRAVDPTKPSAGYRPLSALRGAIDQISLASILTLLEMERKTGLLLIERPEGGCCPALPAQRPGGTCGRRGAVPHGRQRRLRSARLDRRRIRFFGRGRRRHRRHPSHHDLPSHGGGSPAGRGARGGRAITG